MLLKQQYIKLIFWIFAIAVLILSAMPGSINHSIQHLDKLAHIGTFFLLSILLLFAYTLSRPFITAALIMTLFGFGIEVLHLYVPRRVFSLYDFAADLLGIMAALIVFRILSSKLIAAS
jgi:VanZ family protein